MKKIIGLIFIIMFVVGCKIFNDTYSISNNQVTQTKFSFLNNIENVAYVDTFTIYGRFFNLSGYINSKVDNLILVLKNDDFESEYSLILENKDNKTYFKTTELINLGINLENINLGEYIILLKTVQDDKNIYYSLKNNTSYSNLDYYTITKDNKNNEIKLEFLKKNNQEYLSLNCNISLNDDYYDIVIDPGHGGKDVGATRNGYRESNINLDYAKSLKSSLEKLGLKVKLTREEDITLDNYGKNSRVSVPYEAKAKLMLSIHQNSSKSMTSKGGFEVYIVNKTSKEFAEILVSNIKKYTSSLISDNVSYKIDSGIYLRTLALSDLEDIKKDALENNYIPYEKATTSSTYYYMIREVGGIITNSYVDGRNKEKPGNLYYNSNHGIEAYLLEMGYINSSSNLKIILNEKDKYIEAITESVKKYLNI